MVQELAGLVKVTACAQRIKSWRRGGGGGGGGGQSRYREARLARADNEADDRDDDLAARRKARAAILQDRSQHSRGHAFLGPGTPADLSGPRLLYGSIYNYNRRAREPEARPLFLQAFRRFF
jgi:hypothetical protein